MQIWNIVTAVASFSWCSRCSVRSSLQLGGLGLDLLLLLGVFLDALVAGGRRFAEGFKGFQFRGEHAGLDPLRLVERPLIAGLELADERLVRVVPRPQRRHRRQRREDRRTQRHAQHPPLSLLAVFGVVLDVFLGLFERDFGFFHDDRILAANCRPAKVDYPLSVVSPVLSLLIPAYNEERLLPAVIDRVRASFDAVGFAAYEIVVCDNNSTDATGEVARPRRAGRPRTAQPDQPRPQHGGARGPGQVARFSRRRHPAFPRTAARDDRQFRGRQDRRRRRGHRVRRGQADPSAVRLLASWNWISRTFGLAAGSYVFCLPAGVGRGRRIRRGRLRRGGDLFFPQTQTLGPGAGTGFSHPAGNARGHVGAQDGVVRPMATARALPDDDASRGGEKPGGVFVVVHAAGGKGFRVTQIPQ